MNVRVKGTNIGAATDFDGKYTISIPNKNSYLEFSAVGYKTVTVPVNSSEINVELESGDNLETVVVNALGVKRKAFQRKKFSVDDLQEETNEADDEDFVAPVSTKQVKHQTMVDFTIDMPYTVNSDNKLYTVAIKVNRMKTDYQYLAIPKIIEQAYLIANVTDWEKYNFLEGEADIFFEDTFVGKTILDVQNAKDTLKISLGNDKGVIVKRQLSKDFSKKQLIGNKKEITKAWKIFVKNNKSHPINILIKDQVPVSHNKEIKVEVLELSGGKLDEETGTVSWKLNLSPKQKKELMLKYQVKYPKFSNVIVE